MNHHDRKWIMLMLDSFIHDLFAIGNEWFIYDRNALSGMPCFQLFFTTPKPHEVVKQNDKRIGDVPWKSGSIITVSPKWNPDWSDAGHVDLVPRKWTSVQSARTNISKNGQHHDASHVIFFCWTTANKPTYFISLLILSYSPANI